MFIVARPSVMCARVCEAPTHPVEVCKNCQEGWPPVSGMGLEGIPCPGTFASTVHGMQPLLADCSLQSLLADGSLQSLLPVNIFIVGAELCGAAHGPKLSWAMAVFILMM